MDASDLDHLARALARSGPRRAVLGFLTTLPLLGAPVDADVANAQGRRKRRKKQHKHGRPRPHGTRKNPRCQSGAFAVTCEGRCGLVKDTCKKTIDCGPCDCDPPCEICFTCQGEPGTPSTCVPSPAGTPCGNPTTCDSGQVIPGESCDGSGVCQRGTPFVCPPYTLCNGDACASPCRDDRDCFPVAHCNAAHQCVPNAPN